MKEIKFRGQDKANKKWIYGNLEIPLINQNKSKHYIIGYSYGQYQKHEVDPKTVGQFTCSKDINGKDVYVGDIVKEDTNIAVVMFGEYQANNNRIYNNEPAYGFYLEYLSHKDVIDHATKLSYYEVIGNIYENTELLGNK